MSKRTTVFELMLPLRDSRTPAYRWLYSLRLGYLVIPLDLVTLFRDGEIGYLRHTALLERAVLYCRGSG